MSVTLGLLWKSWTQQSTTNVRLVSLTCTKRTHQVTQPRFKVILVEIFNMLKFIVAELFELYLSVKCF